MTVPSENDGSNSPERSAPTGTIGTPPHRRSSRLSALLTTITCVSHTWLARRVPFLIIDSVLDRLLLGRRGAQTREGLDDLPAQDLARSGGGQLVAKHYLVGSA